MIAETPEEMEMLWHQRHGLHAQNVSECVRWLQKALSDVKQCGEHGCVAPTPSHILVKARAIWNELGLHLDQLDEHVIDSGKPHSI